MCLYNCGRKHQIAEEDVTCYKIMRYDIRIGKLRSIHYPGQTYVLGDEIVPDVDMDVSELDGQYKFEKGVVYSFQGRKCSEDIFGHYAEDFSFRVEKDELICLVKCIIPKGTPYWTDSTWTEIFGGEIASKKVIIKDILKDNAYSQWYCPPNPLCIGIDFSYLTH